MSKLQVIDWGLIDYRMAESQQLECIEKIAANIDAEEKIIFCTHPAIVTLGRGTRTGDVYAWLGDTHEVARGGRATYHGPSQILIYPLVNLNFQDTRSHLKSRDLHSYLRTLENAVVKTLAVLGIESHGKADTTHDNSKIEEATGVWVGNRKIASVGIGVKKWITFHGVALNVEKDPQAFQGMNPCGFSADIMTSVEEVLGHPVDRQEIQKLLQIQFMEMLE